ncbi:hypothetical protein CEXT_136921 [Caerostris extrusa]|uniref:Uncharacterized protein n=1 Tax=Caerostris extrusa TaxID=172846 RepID=A0AAV4U7I8_CAEEX|nr:hypothetical protein CEXT_136921 [Caerostris extrusa]
MICKCNEGEGEGLPLIHEHSKTPLRKIEAASHQRRKELQKQRAQAHTVAERKRALRWCLIPKWRYFAFLKIGWQNTHFRALSKRVSHSSDKIQRRSGRTFRTRKILEQISSKENLRKLKFLLKYDLQKQRRGGLPLIHEHSRLLCGKSKQHHIKGDWNSSEYRHTPLQKGKEP